MSRNKIIAGMFMITSLVIFVFACTEAVLLVGRSGLENPEIFIYIAGTLAAVLAVVLNYLVLKKG